MALKEPERGEETKPSGSSVQREQTGRIPGWRRRKMKPRPSPRIKQSPRAAVSVLRCTPKAGTRAVRDRRGPAKYLPCCLLSSPSPWCARLSRQLRHISSLGTNPALPLASCQAPPPHPGGAKPVLGWAVPPGLAELFFLGTWGTEQEDPQKIAGDLQR